MSIITNQDQKMDMASTQSHQTSSATLSETSPPEGELKEETEEEKEKTNTQAKRWKQKAENDKQDAAAANQNKKTIYFLRRQTNGFSNVSTIPGTLGGQSQIPEVRVGKNTFKIRQRPLIENGILNSPGVPVYVAVNKELHSFVPGAQIANYEEAAEKLCSPHSGTVNLDIAGFLKKHNLPEDHPFPLFVGTGCKKEDPDDLTGEWWYVGDYTYWKCDDDQVQKEHPEYRYKNMLEHYPDSAKMWLTVLADKTKDWSNSLNRLQERVSIESLPTNELNVQDVYHQAVKYLREKNMTDVQSGTMEDRVEATRHFLTSGVITIEYVWLKFHHFDKKLNTCLQERATGKNATVQQHWKIHTTSKKRSSSSTSSKNEDDAKSTPKRTRRRSGAVLVRPVEVKWPDDKGVYEKYSGDLFEYKDDKAKYIQFESEKTRYGYRVVNKKYDINEMKNENVKGADVKFKKNIVDPTLEDEWFKMLYK